MDLKGSLIDTCLKVYPSNKLLKYLHTFDTKDKVPANIANFIKDNHTVLTSNVNHEISLEINNDDLKILQQIKNLVNKNEENCKLENDAQNQGDSGNKENCPINEENNSQCKKTGKTKKETCVSNKESEKNGELDKKVEVDIKKPYLTTQDITWLYMYLCEKRKTHKDTPYLHELLDGSVVDTPDNKIMKRNPELEARCKKLRAQQEAREYRSMTKGVDNVRIRYPEDSISFQLKQLNRQLIAIGQFIISIFAGFLFGFKGVEWMIGSLDFGFRLLLGVMCALVIALAEIYFLAKRLNEELNLTQSETIQIGGPPKLKEQIKDSYTKPLKDKEHTD